MVFEMRDKRYRCSSARTEALERLKFLVDGASAASRNSTPTQVRNMTYHSAIFQASSTLEEYLKQVFDHWLFELKRHNKTGQNIPSIARFSYFGRELSRTFSSYAHSGDEKKLAQKLRTHTDVIDFVAGNSHVLPHLTGEFAYKDRKYPSPKNIKALYTRIGCDNIFQILSRQMKSDAELKLQGFNDIRTAIAHGAPPDITLIDVKKNLNDVALIIRHLDKVNHKEFSKDFGGVIW